MSNALTQRRIVRVLVANELLLQGLKLGSEVILCQIVPAVDRYAFGMMHWLFFASPDFPVTETGALVPEYRFKFEHNQIEGTSVTLEPA